MTLELEDAWSPAEDNSLRNGLLAGHTFTMIANVLLRNEDDVITRAAWLQRCANTANANTGKVGETRTLMEVNATARMKAQGAMGGDLTGHATRPYRRAVTKPVEPEPVVEPEVEEAAEPEPYSPPKGHCRSSRVFDGEQRWCILRGRHKGDHLTDYINGNGNAMIFTRGGDAWPDHADVYLTYCLQQDYVAPS